MTVWLGREGRWTSFAQDRPRSSYGPVIRAAKCQDDSRILPACFASKSLEFPAVPIPESCDAFDGSIDVAACRIAKDGRRKEM